MSAKDKREEQRFICCNPGWRWGKGGTDHQYPGMWIINFYLKYKVVDTGY
jgi:hypothetical protein